MINKAVEEIKNKNKSRIETIRAWDFSPNMNIPNIPLIPLDHKQSSQENISTRLAIYISFNYKTVINAKNAFLCLWENNNFQLMSLPIRLIILNDIDNSKSIEKCNQLVLGSKLNIELPWGGKSKEKAINIMEMIDKFDDKETKETYNFLSESCHPNHLASVYWNLNNWNNKRFAGYLEDTINKTLEALEKSLTGMSRDGEKALKIANNYLSKKQ
ncbi:MAG: hypothetical protein KKC80_08215 [Candidatus Margulisbacteria bacterium]|nr:hypothetical protein [Candidatus Margulisiibacteriota bacterium]MBU1616583.1 hypothetical protein [Candidatus Margulisiibacteriota bacterium]